MEGTENYLNIKTQDKDYMMTAIFFRQFTHYIYSIFNRHNLVDAVIGSYGTIMAAQRGEVVCEVITAKVRNGHIVFINLHTFKNWFIFN